ncbi:unnamed protein product [Paramecium pentaurelia]|uniref:Uncharacterized protein n=1 Tax=Paramecium pentaurelia TaxID=43138 RepID=A0A8S1S8J5_9CILI|nr:unnamed protein product [Paramecium pentaurelia]
MINNLGNDEEFLLLQLQQKGRQLEQENFQLRKELSNLRTILQFNLNRLEVKTKDPDNNEEKEQIKYVLTHSTHIQKRKAEVQFQEQSKTAILQGSGEYSDQQNINIKQFQVFSYKILMNDELQQHPNIIATESKIEIIFDRKQQNKISN